MDKKKAIQKERGEYKRERKKRFLYLKNTGQWSEYYRTRMLKRIQKRWAEEKIKREKIIGELKWWQRIYVVLVLGFKRLWRNYFGKMKRGK